MIERKTAVLFAAASELGALLGGGNARVRADARAFGLNLGFAFQIADDVLDYTADESSLGKRIGDDLAEGKATLPLIHALTRADAGVVRRLQEIVRAGDSSAMPEVLAAIHATGAIEYCRGRAERYAANARQATTELPDSAHTTALRTLCGYAVARDR